MRLRAQFWLYRVRMTGSNEGATNGKGGVLAISEWEEAGPIAGGAGAGEEARNLSVVKIRTRLRGEYSSVGSPRE